MMGVRVREKVKGSGEWWVFVNHKGTRASQKIGDKRTANAVKKKLEAEIATGSWQDEKSNLPTLAVQTQAFIDSPLRDWSDRTHDETRSLFKNHIEPALGNTPIDEIRPRHIKKLLGDILAKDLSSSTARGTLRILNCVLQDAVEDELIQANPCLGMGKYCGNGTVKDVNPLEAHEVEQMLENSKAAPVVFRTLIILGVRTGLRIGELLALEWTDVDLDGRTLQVNKAYDYQNKKVKTTKTETTRTVRLTPQAVEALEKLREVKGPTGIVFTVDSSYLSHYHADKWLKVVTPRYITLHDLRHTYATLRIAKGDNIVDVSKQLGHSKIETTLRHYTKWIPQDDYIHQVDELDTLHLSAPQAHPKISKTANLH
jgi:integrase